MAIHYRRPHIWIQYDMDEVATALVEAKAAVESLKNAPYQRSWVEGIQQLELKREIAGTSRIEGADFTDPELEAAIKSHPSEVPTRSQKQASAAVRAYRFIADLDCDVPVDRNLLFKIHARIVEGCDDDRCPPGQPRKKDENVVFGQPRHRGASGGEECRECIDELVLQINTSFRDHDPLVQAIAAHYHLAAMHPFLDGNGRTARAIEALLLMRAGLRDSCFIAMSNYYYDEKPDYLAKLAQVRKEEHNLTSFLVFALKGVTLQSNRLLAAIRKATQKLLYRDIMRGFSERLLSPRKRVLTKRQFGVLELLLQEEDLEATNLYWRVQNAYGDLRAPLKAFVRDMNALISMEAITWTNDEKGDFFHINLEWPTIITETQFYEMTRKLPKTQYTFSRR